MRGVRRNHSPRTRAPRRATWKHCSISGDTSAKTPITFNSKGQAVCSSVRRVSTSCEKPIFTNSLLQAAPNGGADGLVFWRTLRQRVQQVSESRFCAGGAVRDHRVLCDLACLEEFFHGPKSRRPVVLVGAHFHYVIHVEFRNHRRLQPCGLVCRDLVKGRNLGRLCPLFQLDKGNRTEDRTILILIQVPLVSVFHCYSSIWG